MKFKKQIGIFEIFLLVSFSFAFSFMFGESVGVVSAVTYGVPGYIEGVPPGFSAPPVTAPTPASSPLETNLIRDAGGQIIGIEDAVTRKSYMVDSTGAPVASGLGGLSRDALAGTTVTKSVFYDGKLYEGVIVMRSDLGIDVARLKGVGPVSWDSAANSGAGDWVPSAEGTVPAGLEESGKLAATTPTPDKAGGLGGIFSGSTFGTEWGTIGGFSSALLSGLVWGAIVGGIAYGAALLFGQSQKQAASIGLSAGGGTFVGTTSMFLAQQYAVAHPGAFTTFTPGMFGLTLGIAVGVTILLMTYKKEKKGLVRFECLAWEPPRGGANCDECNNDPYMPCSEYRCKSLGQGCELINKGSEEEKCVWITKGDTSAPHMTPWEQALKPEGLRYVPDSSVSPPNRGFKLVDNTGNECLQPFTNLEFGVLTDEPAQCKIDLEPKATYDEMQFLFGSSNLFLEEHKQKIKVPSPFTEEGEVTPEIGIDGTFTLWVRCIDANENGKDGAMVAFRYCVDPAPDTTQPMVVGTDITSGSYVSFNADAVPIEVYTNEPAECRWSRQDRDFDSMENSMQCSTESYQINADLNYVCSGQLTGIENRAENWFYFRCRDFSTAPGGRNTMATSYPLLLRGTEELVIKSVGPIGEFTSSASVATVTLTAETAHGAEEGKSICYFDIDNDGLFNVAMENTDSYVHNQSLDLTSGIYTFYFRCIDDGGNSAEANTTFSVVVDTTLPSVTRIFKDENVLKVITNEEAKCTYSETNCNFNTRDGLPFLYQNPTDKTVHTAEWKEDITYYIKCEDLLGNQPRPDFCQIIAKASEL